MSFDDVANRMQQRHANHMVPTHAVDDSYAQSYEQSIVDSERSSRKSSDLVIGGLLFGLGLLVTVGTYNSASESGGTYFIAYGPMIVGVIRIFRGLAA
jgi:hypothetical protein